MVWRDTCAKRQFGWVSIRHAATGSSSTGIGVLGASASGTGVKAAGVRGVRPTRSALINASNRALHAGVCVCVSRVKTLFHMHGMKVNPPYFINRPNLMQSCGAFLYLVGRFYEVGSFRHMPEIGLQAHHADALARSTVRPCMHLSGEGSYNYQLLGQCSHPRPPRPIQAKCPVLWNRA